MIVSKVEWPTSPGIPYVILTIDTQISSKEIPDIRVVRSRIAQWIKKRYSILPASLGGLQISRGDAIEYINNRHSGTDCYTSRYSIQIKNWVESNHISRFVFQMYGIWCDPATSKWLTTIECYDPDYTVQ